MRASEWDSSSLKPERQTMSVPSDPDSLDRFNDWLKPKTKRDLNRGEQGLDLSGRADAPYSLTANPAELPPIVVTCGNCSGVLHAPGDSGGQQGSCPTCGNVLRIPTPSPVARVRMVIDLRSKPRVDSVSHQQPPLQVEPPTSPPPASSQPSAGWDIEKSVIRFFSQTPPQLYVPLLLIVAGFIFYQCLGGPPTRTTKPGAVEKYFNVAKPK